MKNKILLITLIGLLFTNGCKKNDNPTPPAEKYLWGISLFGGTNNKGAIYKMKRDGSAYEVVYSFNGIDSDQPSGFVKESDGKLLGSTLSSEVFEFNTETNTYSNRFSITSSSTQGAVFTGNPVLHSGSKYYGTCYGGGTNDNGVIYSFDAASLTYTKLLDFNGAVNGAQPRSSMVLAGNGIFYGATASGGTGDYGILFSFNPATNTYLKIHEFTAGTDGASPWGDLMLASDGNVYGMTQYGGNTGGLGTIYRIDPSTNIYTKVYAFPAGSLSGAYADGGLVEKDGFLYGMTRGGGANSEGTIFKFNPTTYALQKLYDFSATNDGSYPLCSLLLSSDGNFYGTTSAGGANSKGTAFSFNPSTSVFTKLHDFGSGTDAQLGQARAGLIEN